MSETFTNAAKYSVFHVAPHGAGLYRNLETGLRREFCRPPVRGKWTLVRPRRYLLKEEV